MRKVSWHLMVPLMVNLASIQNQWFTLTSTKYYVLMFKRSFMSARNAAFSAVSVVVEIAWIKAFSLSSFVVSPALRLLKV